MKKSCNGINVKGRKYLIGNIMGISFFLLGIFLIVLKGFTSEYIDGFGILHEKFFLIPIGFIFMLIGILLLIVLKIIAKFNK